MKNLITRIHSTAQPIIISFIGAAVLALSSAAQAQEGAIRKNLPKNMPNLPKITEVRSTPITGLYEVTFEGNDVLYTNADGRYLIEGQLMEVASKRNLTAEREEKLNFIPFEKLPLADSITIVRGNGSRKMAVFADPNCGYCKRFENDLLKVDNVTVHVFVYPILGADSIKKAENIWCAKDKGKVWLDWMTKNQTIPSADGCDTSAIKRVVEFGRQKRISGTPYTLFANGKKANGAISLAQIERSLAAN